MAGLSFGPPRWGFGQGFFLNKQKAKRFLNRYVRTFPAFCRQVSQSKIDTGFKPKFLGHRNKTVCCHQCGKCVFLGSAHKPINANALPWTIDEVDRCPGERQEDELARWTAKCMKCPRWGFTMFSMSNPDQIATEIQVKQADETVAQDDTVGEQGAVVIPDDVDLRVEAVLMSTDCPQPAAKMAQLVGVGAKVVQEAIKRLNQRYDETGRSFRIEPVARGWQVMTLPKFAELLAQAHKGKAAMRLTPAALETLAIIAYKQPVLRADVESIRGVASGEVIRGLMERRLVTIAGRAQELGRPILYGTTRSFLEIFGLAGLKDLPKVEELWQKQ